MNWYNKIKIASKTLYHGTSIDNYDSIKNLGLIPDVGNFVRDSYQDEYDHAGVDFDPTPLVYATDKEDLGKAVTAMMNAVANMLGRNWLNDITLDELKSYGMLVIIKQGQDYFEQRPWEEEGQYGDWQYETDNQYPAVEPGDYYSEDTQEGQILIGNKMVSFLTKQGLWPPYQLEGGAEEKRKNLLTMAIRYHVKESPEKRNEIITAIQSKVNSLTDEEVESYYKQYSELINELV